MMFDFKIGFCCCGCSLREGTLALLILNLLFYGWLLLQCIFSEHVGITMKLFLILWFATKVVGIYGVLKEKPKWLIPHIVTQIITLGSYVFFIFLLFFGKSLLHDAISSMSSKEVPSSAFNPPVKDISDAVNTFLWFFIVIFVILAALQYHFILVVHSTLWKIKDESAALSNIGLSSVAHVAVHSNVEKPL